MNQHNHLQLQKGRLHPVKVTCWPLGSGPGCSSSLSSCACPFQRATQLSESLTAQQARDVLPSWGREKSRKKQLENQRW